MRRRIAIVEDDAVIRANYADVLGRHGYEVAAFADRATALAALHHGAGITSLVLEGGAALHRAALDAGVVDAVHLYITPTRIGPLGVNWIGERRLAWDGLKDRRSRWLGADILVEGRVEHVHRTH